MSESYDKSQWQAEQAARDIAIEKQRDKERKTRERAARNAKRKLERLRRMLSDYGDITDFENEFGQSVAQRLDKFGSAFHDREKGRPSDALSFAQKRVMAAMNKKVKDLKRAQTADDTDDNEPAADRYKNKKTSPFKNKGGFKSKFTPRVRHIEDDMIMPIVPDTPTYIAEYTPLKKPFLRIVKSD